MSLLHSACLQSKHWKLTLTYGSSIHYDAGGSAIKELTCQSTFWQNPSWTSPSDGLYSIETLECTPVDISMPVEWITAVA